MTEPETTHPVFRVSAGIRALSVCFLGPLVVLGLAGPWFIPLQPGSSAARSIFFLAGIAASGTFAWALSSAFRTRLEFLPGAIRLTRAIGDPIEIRSDEIEGFRVIRSKSSGILRVFFKDAARKPLRIDMSFERREELLSLLGDRCTNLDDVDSKAEMKEILSDPELGSTEEEREAALQRARIQVGVLNTATAVSVFWAMLYPRPYFLVIAVLAALPLVSACLLHFSRGAIVLDAKRGSARPIVGYSILGPSMVLVLRSFLDWHILGWSGFWLPFAVLAGTLIGFLLLSTACDAQRKAGSVMLLFVAGMAISYGVVVFSNCQLDHSMPAIHRAEVLSRRISRGRRSTTYYLTVRPWIDGDYPREISVPGSTYGWHEEGSTVLIGVRGGALSMPWYFVQ
jgi:hypothetical protein